MDWRIWVMVALLLGMLQSSLGNASSHGIAAVAVVLHGGDEARGHAHDDDLGEPQAVGDNADHAHHNSSDHSHDKAHALPVKLSIDRLDAPVWRPIAHRLDAGWVVSRMDRPPMA